MTEFQPSNIRVSDTEREDALNKLGEHMSAGRLDLEEYGERTAKVAAAKTRGELLNLFGDLPEPKPTFGQPLPSVPPPPKRSVTQRVSPVLLPVIVIVAVVALIAVTKMFFLIIPAIFIALNASWWRGGNNHRRHHHREWRDQRG